MFDRLRLRRNRQRPLTCGYPDGVSVRADDVAREIRARLPGVGTKKLHKLLYLCQGHHVAFSSEPLFEESISAWDHGPVVGRFWWREKEGGAAPASSALDEGQLNTVGYVLSRYGRLSGRDLEDLTHAQPPWEEADRSRDRGTSSRIDVEAMRTFFSEDLDDSDDVAPIDSQAVRDWLAGADERRRRPARRDSEGELRRRLSDAG